MKILIVDDDSVIQEMLVHVFGSYGTSSHVAVDGQQAVEAVNRALDEKEPYKLICIDFNLAGLNSLQTLQRIREIEKERGIKVMDRVKVFMLSASIEPEDISRAYREGQCDSYLNKPLDMDIFREQLQKIGMSLPEEEEE